MRISKYGKEFRDSTVQLILNNNESVIKVASDLDINSKTLYHWVKMYKKEHNIPSKTIQSSYYHWIKAGCIIKKVKMKRRYKNTTDSNHNLPIAPNILNRDFYASNPDEKWVGNII